MKLAYIILFHKDPEQLFALVDRLNERETTFIIHVCKKTPRSVFNIVKRHFEFYSNVYFCKRENGQWGAFGIVQGTINACEILSEKKVEFDYVSLISAQDFPVKSNDEIKSFFERNKGTEYITVLGEVFGNEPAVVEAWGEQRFLRFGKHWIHSPVTKKYLVIPENRFAGKSNWYIIKTFRKNFVKNVKGGTLVEDFFNCYSHIKHNRVKAPIEEFVPVAGSQWFSISRDCFAFVLSQARKNHIKKYFDTNLLSDESFFNSIIYNSPFKSRIHGSNLRFIDWNGSHPRNLTSEDYELLKNDGRYLFARKFEFEEVMKILGKKAL